MDSNVIQYLSSSELLDKISDIARVVDPMQKKVIAYKNGDQVSDEIHCFDFWGKNKVCDNCISMRAYNDNAAYVKFECQNDKTYMITAVPYALDDRRVVIEILKDITKSFLFNSSEDNTAEQTGFHMLIDNMNKLAFSDSLTGLYNRRFIDEKLPVDLMSSAMLSTELSIIIADIDLFKNVNDQYGHIAGDYTLKRVADILTGCIQRAGDWVARFGGEEFMVCMPGANLETVTRTAELMRKALEDSVIRYDGKDFGITASFGIYNLRPTGDESADDLIMRADEKLYLAKDNGRNRVEY